MDHIRALASWITTGVVTVGLAVGLVAHHGLGQPVKSSITETHPAVATTSTTVRTPHVSAPVPTSSPIQPVQSHDTPAPATPVVTRTETPTTVAPTTTIAPTTTTAPAPTVTYTGGDGAYAGDN